MVDREKQVWPNRRRKLAERVDRQLRGLDDAHREAEALELLDDVPDQELVGDRENATALAPASAQKTQVPLPVGIHVVERRPANHERLRGEVSEQGHVFFVGAQDDEAARAERRADIEQREHRAQEPELRLDDDHLARRSLLDQQRRQVTEARANDHHGRGGRGDGLR